mgnify:CR=1 FL=1
MKIKDVRSMKLTMQLKSRSYDIILKAGCLANLHQFTNVANRKVFVLTDSGVPAEYAQTVAAQCPDSTVYTIPRGEGSKCLKVYGQVLQAMLAFGMDRKDLLVSVGGGVVGDLGGFCAASYMRGIDFVNCPTTVLSQVDSSIGGKTAIDLGETKNIVGAFWQPKVVLVDFDTLKTLPRRQVVNGLAEALKTGIIGDPQLFALFECEHPEDNIEQIVYRSLKFKKKIVEQDEREGSVRACLNFGHTHRPRHRSRARCAGPPYHGPVPRRMRRAGYAADDRGHGPAQAHPGDLPRAGLAHPRRGQQGEGPGLHAA